MHSTPVSIFYSFRYSSKQNTQTAPFWWEPKTFVTLPRFLLDRRKLKKCWNWLPKKRLNLFRTFLEQTEESIRFPIMLFSSSFYFDFLSQVFKADRSFTSQILNCFQNFEAIVNTPNFFCRTICIEVSTDNWYFLILVVLFLKLLIKVIHNKNQSSCFNCCSFFFKHDADFRKYGVTWVSLVLVGPWRLT